MIKSLRISILVLFFVALVALCCHAQTDRKSESRYNLNHVSVELLSGRLLKGRLVWASYDSLVMIEKHTIAVGCMASLRIKPTNTLVQGNILEITDSTLVIEQKTAPYRTIFYFHQIDFISVGSCPAIVDLEKFKRVVCVPSSVKSIRMHKKGSGGLGAFLGVVLVGGIGVAIAAGSSESGSSGNGEGGLAYAIYGALGVLIGAPLGAAIGSSNKTYPINGQQEQFDLFVKRLYK